MFDIVVNTLCSLLIQYFLGDFNEKDKAKGRDEYAFLVDGGPKKETIVILKYIIILYVTKQPIESVAIQNMVIRAGIVHHELYKRFKEIYEDHIGYGEINLDLYKDYCNNLLSNIEHCYPNKIEHLEL